MRDITAMLQGMIVESRTRVQRQDRVDETMLNSTAGNTQSPPKSTKQNLGEQINPVCRIISSFQSQFESLE